MNPYNQSARLDPQPAPTPLLSTGFEELSKQISLLEERRDEITQRLDPVCLPSVTCAPEPAEKVPAAPTLSPIAQRLLENSRRIERVISNLETLLARLR